MAMSLTVITLPATLDEFAHVARWRTLARRRARGEVARWRGGAHVGRRRAGEAALREPAQLLFSYGLNRLNRLGLPPAATTSPRGSLLSLLRSFHSALVRFGSCLFARRQPAVLKPVLFGSCVLDQDGDRLLQDGVRRIAEVCCN